MTADDPTLAAALLAWVEPTTRGDPASPLRWTGKSCAQLAAVNSRATPSVPPPWAACCTRPASVCKRPAR